MVVTKKIATKASAIFVAIFQSRLRGRGLAHGLLHQRGELRLFSGTHLDQRKTSRPHIAIVEVLPVREFLRRLHAGQVF